MTDDAAAWRTVRLVAEREVRTRITTKAWRAVTLLLMVLVVAVILGTKALSSTSGSVHVGLLPSAQPVARQLVAEGRALGTTIETEAVSDDAAARALVQSGRLESAIGRSGSTLLVTVNKSIDPGIQQTVTALARQLALQQQITGLGGDAGVVEQAVAAAKVSVTKIQPAPIYDNSRLVYGVLAGVLIFMALQINGQMVAQGVVEEKATRVVELLLAAVKPWQLMAGKVVGIAVVGLTQLSLIAGAGLVAAVRTGELSISLGQAGIDLVWLAVWFVLGFTAYALAIAAAAALVSRQEDVQSVLMPVLAPLIVAYILGITVVPRSPNGTIARVLSIFPASAPAAMPMRIAIGAASPLEVIVALALMAATIPGLILLAGRVYQNAVVHSGARIHLVAALRTR